LDVVAFAAAEAPALCVLLARPSPLFEPVDELAPPCTVHVLLSSVVGDGPADVFATRHVDPEGAPAAPLPSDPFAEKSSEAEDGSVPQLVPRLTSVGTPGEASAVEHVEAMVGSSAEPTPASEPANEPVTVATAFARIPESVVETLVWLASASAEGPDVVGAGAEPSGCGWVGPRCRPGHRHRRGSPWAGRGGRTLRGRARAGGVRAPCCDRLARCDGGRPGVAATGRSGSAYGRALRVGLDNRLSRKGRIVGESQTAPHIQEIGHRDDVEELSHDLNSASACAAS
jgi:hypothetical protein